MLTSELETCKNLRCPLPPPHFLHLTSLFLSILCDHFGPGSMSHLIASSPFLTPPMINHILLSSLSLSLISLFSPLSSSLPFACLISPFSSFLPPYLPPPQRYYCSPPPAATASSLGEQKVYGQWGSLSHCLAFSMIRLSLKSAEWG